jgi:ribosomal protein L37AE/L43A
MIWFILAAAVIAAFAIQAKYGQAKRLVNGQGSFVHLAVTDKGAKCPRCGGTNTNRENGIWYCYDCQKEW